ncbi:hypothetical protein [Xenorhabdus hominickii]|uniref:Uncharacterized protein n=1 Tax=Xenorhabdus hominickii TaxID=351679 RepID=A0A2G0PT71_XENHO|nr:hypothetical protein [Xenorhabdus hominickii]AOM40507.1 hypothetical protein A9255_07865 [Xenorhabdus hominickii]PHM50171.1 hypothetical protein Xhom_04997 [Xenorhabdus hominickii]
METQMQLAQEAIARLKSMSRQELLSVLIKAGVADADAAAPSVDESEGGVADAFKEFKDKLRDNINVRVYKKDELLIIESSLYVPWCDSGKNYLKVANIFDPSQPIKREVGHPITLEMRVALVYEHIVNAQKENLMSSVEYYMKAGVADADDTAPEAKEVG